MRVVIVSLWVLTGVLHAQKAGVVRTPSTAPAVRIQPPDIDKPQGVDVSHHNGQIDWRKIRSTGIAFVFVKATDGIDYIDPMYATHFREAKAAGLISGAYHFYETNDDGEGQADWFIKNISLGPGDLPPVVDIERVKAPVDGNIHTQFRKFIERLTAHYGSRPIIYTGPRFWEHVMKEHLPGNPLWIAEYDVKSPTVPPEWSQWTFWQYTHTLAMPGAETDLDGSLFNGDPMALKALLLPAK